MTDNGNRLALGRKLLVAGLLMGVFALFLTLYFFVYAPRQESFYNKSTFRILSELAGNFSARLDGYGEASNNNATVARPITLDNSTTFFDSTDFKKLLDNSITGAPNLAHETRTQIDFSNDTVLFKQVNDDHTKSLNEVLFKSLYLKPDSVHKKSIKDILEPVLSVHAEDFESVILADLSKDSSQAQILYKSENLSIDEEINKDSLLQTGTAFTSPTIKDITIESVEYKLFLYPFRFHHKRLLLGAFVNRHNYKQNAQNFPASTLLLLGLVLTVVLLSLPFLKIFLIGPQENIAAKDLRSIISMVYIVPFFFILVVAACWVYYITDAKSTKALTTLNKEVTTNFYTEIDSSIQQLKYYDHNFNVTAPGYENLKQYFSAQLHTKSDTVNYADLYFNPTAYKNLDWLFWMNKSGDEIAKWNFIATPQTYLRKADRQYFKDLQNNGGYKLPYKNVGDTFVIQPLLSKSNGEYSIVIVKHSNTIFSNDTSVMIGLSGKLYSVFQPVTERGYNFCMVNASGEILYHSQSQRNLEENIYNEADNNYYLKSAIKRKDSVLLDDIKLYGKDVKLLVTPVKGLDCYLVCYVDKRMDILFLFHIIAFSFFCGSLMLMIVSLISFFFYYSNTHFSPLFFSQNELDFAKPSPRKEMYYKKLVLYHVLIIIVLFLLSLIFSGKAWFFFVMNLSVLMPLLSVFGYYIIRCIEDNRPDVTKIEKEDATQPENGVMLFKRLLQLLPFRKNMYWITRLYIVIIITFHAAEFNITHSSFPDYKSFIYILLFIIEIGFPVLAFYITLHDLPAWFQKNNQSKETTGKRAYLSYFIIALLLSATVTGILPAIGFIMNATEQEKSLQLKSQQMYLARELQDHRDYVNNKVSLVKKDITTATDALRLDYLKFVDSLKFAASKGLYLNNNHLSTVTNWPAKKDSAEFNNSNFYAIITKFLFIPKDHVDFFTNLKDYYFWTSQKDTKNNTENLVFHYRNETDHADSSHLVLSQSSPTSTSLFSIFHYRRGVFLIVCLVLFILIFYNLILTVTKRIFLIGYFEKEPAIEQDVHYLDNKFFKEVSLTDEFELTFWDKYVVTKNDIIQKEKAYPENTRERDECILKIQILLAATYEKIWQSLTPVEQFVLYDLAYDSFTNYKNVDVLYLLYKKGLLVKDDHYLVIFCKSFRNYLINKTGNPQINKLKREVNAGGAWGNLRNVFLALALVIIVFLFIAQEDVTKRVLGILTTLGALIPLMLKLFDRNTASSGGAGASAAAEEK